MKIKSTMRYYLTLVRIAIIKKSTNNKWRSGYEEKELSYTVTGDINWYGYNGEQYTGSLKTKNRTSI